MRNNCKDLQTREGIVTVYINGKYQLEQEIEAEIFLRQM